MWSLTSHYYQGVSYFSLLPGGSVTSHYYQECQLLLTITRGLVTSHHYQGGQLLATTFQGIVATNSRRISYYLVVPTYHHIWSRVRYNYLKEFELRPISNFFNISSKFNCSVEYTIILIDIYLLIPVCFQSVSIVIDPETCPIPHPVTSFKLCKTDLGVSLSSAG